jgi:hypothetical protein
MDYNTSDGSARRDRWDLVQSKPVFQADPGASSSEECHHGPVREYEQESCSPSAPLAAVISHWPRRAARQNGGDLLLQLLREYHLLALKGLPLS